MKGGSRGGRISRPGASCSTTGSGPGTCSSSASAESVPSLSDEVSVQCIYIILKTEFYYQPDITCHYGVCKLGFTILFMLGK